MHYYQFNIGDWALHTSHLSLEEEAVYRRILDFYYDTELPIPEDTKPVIRRLRLSQHSEVVDIILEEYFYLEDDGWHNKRVDEEIEKFKAKSDRAKVNGAKGGRPPKVKKEEPKDNQKEPRDNPEKTQPVILANPEESKLKANEELRTKNEELGTRNYKPEDQKTMPGKPDDAVLVIEYLNQVSGSKYQPVESNTKLIKARIAEGRTLEDIKAVIDRKNLEWPPGHPQRQYLRPSTLFNATKFNDYFGQIGQQLPGQGNGNNQSTGRKLSHADNIREQAKRALAEMDAADSENGDGIIFENGNAISEQSQQLPDL